MEYVNLRIPVEEYEKILSDMGKGGGYCKVQRENLGYCPNLGDQILTCTECRRQYMDEFIVKAGESNE